MKITTFNPQIATSDPESVISLFEALGFEQRHTKDDIGIGEMKATACRMKYVPSDADDSNGFYVDTPQASLPVPQSHDQVIIRMNVDDFDEAYKILVDHGFTNVFGNVGGSSTSRGAVMKSPSGFLISLIRHIK